MDRMNDAFAPWPSYLFEIALTAFGRSEHVSEARHHLKRSEMALVEEHVVDAEQHFRHSSSKPVLPVCCRCAIILFDASEMGQSERLSFTCGVATRWWNGELIPVKHELERQ
jgi:hypothetical protein